MATPIKEVAKLVDTIEAKKKFINANLTKLREKITKARAQLFVNPETRFMNSFVMKMPIEFSETLAAQTGYETAGTDGKKIMFDPNFLDGLTTEETIWAIVHECNHGMFGHMNAPENAENHEVANIAQDININAMNAVLGIGKAMKCSIPVEKTGRCELNINGKKIVIENAHTKTSREIYDELKKHIKNNPPKGDGKGEGFTDGNGKDVKGSWDQHIKGKLTKEEQKWIEDQLRRALVEHKMKGGMPGWLAEKLEGMLKARINWRAILADEITQGIKGRPTYSRPNRRFPSKANLPVIPGYLKEELNAAIVMDTSGSIGKDELMYMKGEIASMFKQFASVNLKIYLHNTECYKVLDITDKDELKDADFVSGGTSHVDVIQKLHDDQTKLAIFFTDGYSDYPEENFDNIRKIWVILSDNKNAEEKVPTRLVNKLIPISLNDIREEMADE